MRLSFCDSNIFLLKVVDIFGWYINWLFLLKVARFRIMNYYGVQKVFLCLIRLESMINGTETLVTVICAGMGSEYVSLQDR